MLLEELIKSLNVINKKNYKGNIKIDGLAYHSDRVRESFLYVAIKGYKTDGHKYVEAAMKNGAVVAVVEEFVDVNIPQIKTKNSREALSILSDRFYNHPSRDMRLIGVTATNGKTTTTFMLNDIYEKAGFKTGLVGSVMNKVGEKLIPSELTTPESLDLHYMFSKMRENNVEKVPMEVSSSALELYRVNNVDFDIVSFNNFSREHIDQHGSYEKYWEVKSSLVRNAKKESFVALNIDDEKIRTLVNKTKANVITYSIKDSNADIYCKDSKLVKGRPEFKVVVNREMDGLNGKIKKGEFEVSLGIPGFHSEENAMVAIVISLIDNIPINIIQQALKEFQGVERRFEYIYEDDFLVIDDHFANLKNINVSLGTLSHMDHNNLHLIYAIRGNRGVTVNKENAEAVVAWKDKLNLKEIIATKSIGSVTEKDAVSEQEEKVFKEIITNAGIKLNLYDKLEDAIKHAINVAKEDDIVFLAGCQGMDMGAKIALDCIYGKKPHVKKEELYKPILKRVTGNNI